MHFNETQYTVTFEIYDALKTIVSINNILIGFCSRSKPEVTNVEVNDKTGVSIVTFTFTSTLSQEMIESNVIAIPCFKHIGIAFTPTTQQKFFEERKDALLGFNQSGYMSGSGQMFNTPRNLSPYQQQWNNPESIELNKNVSMLADRVKGIENAISTINQRNLSQSDFFNSKIAELEKRHSDLSAFTESMFHFLSKHNGVLDDKEIEELRNRLNILLKPNDPFSSDKQTPNVSELRPPQKSTNPMEDSLDRLNKANGKS